MKIKLLRTNADYLFECTNAAGGKILLENSSVPGAKGVSPMESLLMAIAACSAIDMVSILKKQRQEIESFAAEVEGERIQMDEAKPFKTIKIQYFLAGTIDPSKASRAAMLSFKKYCSVSKTFDPNISLLYDVYVNGELAKQIV